MSTEDDMWQDYDHYMHTGELSECFEEESEPIHIGVLERIAENTKPRQKTMSQRRDRK